MFLKFCKIPEITSAVEFQALAGSLQNSCSKELLKKVPGRSANVLKKDSTLDILLACLQKFSEHLFFRNTNGRVIPNIQIAFF